MVHNFLEDDFVHELMTLDRLLFGDANELLLQRNWTIAIVEVEQTGLQINTEKRSHVLQYL